MINDNIASLYEKVFGMAVQLCLNATISRENHHLAALLKNLVLFSEVWSIKILI